MRKAFILNKESVQIGKTLYHFPTGEKIAMQDYPKKRECIAIVKVKGNSWVSAQEARERADRGEGLLV